MMTEDERRRNRTLGSIRYLPYHRLHPATDSAKHFMQRIVLNHRYDVHDVYGGKLNGSEAGMRWSIIKSSYRVQSRPPSFFNLLQSWWSWYCVVEFGLVGTCTSTL